MIDIDIAFLTILFLPIIIPWIMKYFFHTTITWKEMSIYIIIVLISTIIMYSISLYSQTSDVEIWNGRVTSKKKERVSCRHSYSCNCRTVSCGKDCTTTHCDTCYEHDYDNDWNVYTNIGNYTINTIDRQGLKEPPRWTSSKVGDPVAKRSIFTNYIKAVPDSLFHDNQELTKKFDGMLPDYPSNVYDYYNINRVLNVKTNIPITNYLNKELSLSLRKLGIKKQNNTIIVFVNTNDPNYRYALENKWLGGKKNDAVVIIGVEKYPDILWVDVFSWSKNEMFNVALRDDINNLKTIDKRLIPVIEENVLKYFSRRHMEEFEYLKDEIEPPLWALFLIFFISMSISCGTAYYMHKNEL